MIYKDLITVYGESSTKYDPRLGKTVEVEAERETYQCNIRVVQDYVNDVQQGRVTGKTIEVRFLRAIPNFHLAVYKGKEYKPVGYEQRKKKLTVTLEEV